MTAPGARPAPRLARGPEFDRIRRLLDSPARDEPGVRVGPGDDCAALEAGDIVVSTDLSIEGVHFEREWLAADQIGFRAVTAALSDLAAVAATPIGVLVSLGLPATTPDDDVEALGRGIRHACDEARAAWLGGDLSASPAGIVLDATVLGRTGAPVLRSGARPGDEVWVTGRLGGSAAAVRMWLRGETPTSALKEAFVRPTARWAEAAWLTERVDLGALIDLSDGLVGDARHVAASSGVRLTLDGFRVPVNAAARKALGAEDALSAALGGGEDYELCFTVRPRALDDLQSSFESAFGLELSRVGTVDPGSGVYVRHRAGAPAVAASSSGGFEHFTDEATTS